MRYVILRGHGRVQCKVNDLDFLEAHGQHEY